MLSPCASVEQTKHHSSDAAQPYRLSMDSQSSRSFKDFLRPLHYQVFCQYHFSRQQYDKQTQNASFGLPRGGSCRHGLPPWMGGRARVEIEDSPVTAVTHLPVLHWRHPPRFRHPHRPDGQHGAGGSVGGFRYGMIHHHPTRYYLSTQNRTSISVWSSQQRIQHYPLQYMHSPNLLSGAPFCSSHQPQT